MDFTTPDHPVIDLWLAPLPYDGHPLFDFGLRSLFVGAEVNFAEPVHDLPHQTWKSDTPGAVARIEAVRASKRIGLSLPPNPGPRVDRLAPQGPGGLP